MRSQLPWSPQPSCCLEPRSRPFFVDPSRGDARLRVVSEGRPREGETSKTAQDRWEELEGADEPDVRVHSQRRYVRSRTLWGATDEEADRRQTRRGIKGPKTVARKGSNKESLNGAALRRGLLGSLNLAPVKAPREAKLHGGSRETISGETDSILHTHIVLPLRGFNRVGKGVTHSTY